MEGASVMTLRQVAAYLKVHPNTVYRLAKRGEMPAFKIGSEWRFNRESIDRWRFAREDLPGSGDSRPDKSPVSEEIVDFLHWYQTEIGEAAGLTEIRSFLAAEEKTIRRELSRLISGGLAAVHDTGAEQRYRLTPEALARARRRSPAGSARPRGHASLMSSVTEGEHKWKR